MPQCIVSFSTVTFTSSYYISLQKTVNSWSYPWLWSDVWKALKYWMDEWMNERCERFLEVGWWYGCELRRFKWTFKELDYKTFKILSIKITPFLAMNSLHFLPEALSPHDHGPMPQEFMLSLNLSTSCPPLIQLSLRNWLSFLTQIWPSGQTFSVLTRGAWDTVFPLPCSILSSQGLVSPKT